MPFQHFNDENTPPTERVTDDERRAVITRWQEQRGFAPSDEATLPDVAEGLDISVADAAHLLAEIRAERAAAHQAELDARRAALEDAETAARLAEAQARQAESEARIHQAAEAKLAQANTSAESQGAVNFLKLAISIIGLLLLGFLLSHLHPKTQNETSHEGEIQVQVNGKWITCGSSDMNAEAAAQCAAVQSATRMRRR